MTGENWYMASGDREISEWWIVKVVEGSNVILGTVLVLCVVNEKIHEKIPLHSSVIKLKCERGTFEIWSRSFTHLIVMCALSS